MTGIFSINDIRRILNEDIPPTLVIASDIATRSVISATPDEYLTSVMKKLTDRNLDEIPVVDQNVPQKVLFMLSRRTLLAPLRGTDGKDQGGLQGINGVSTPSACR